MKSKFLPLAVIAVVLATSVIASTTSVSVVAASSGWHKTTLTHTWERCLYSWEEKKIGETSRYEYWIEKFTITEMDDVFLTITERYDKTKGCWQILSVKYQDSCRLLCFIGMKGTLWMEMDCTEVWVYEISGLGVGSYGPNSRFGDAFVKGTIHLETYDDTLSMEVNFVVTYFVA